MTDLRTLFDRLAGVSLDGLTLSDVSFDRVSDGLVTATSNNADGTTLVVTFEARDDQLTDRVAGLLGSMTLRELAQNGNLPASPYAPAGLPDVQFTGLRTEINAASRLLTITGDGPADAVTLGVGALRVAGTRLALTWYVPEQGAPTNVEAHLTGTLQLGAGLPVRVELPRGASDWQVAALPGTKLTLTGLSDLELVAGEPITRAAPDKVPLPDGLTLTTFGASFDSERQVITTLGLAIETEKPWTVLADHLVLDRCELRVSGALGGPPGTGSERSAATRPGLALTGSIIGTMGVFGVDVTVAIPIQSAEGRWALEAAPDLELPGLGALADGLAGLIGSGDRQASLPTGLEPLGGLVVERLRVEFTPGESAVALDLVRVRAASLRPWRLPWVDVSVEGILIDVQVDQPLVDTRTVTGALAGTLTFGSVFVPVEISKPSGADGWTLRVTYGGLHVGLRDLLSVVGVPPDDFRAAIPESLSIESDLELTGLEVDYNLTDGEVVSAQFDVALTEPWPLVDGYLAVDRLNLAIDAEFGVGDDNRTVVTAVLAARVAIAGVPFELGAANNTPNADWQLHAALAAGERLDLSMLTGDLIRGGLLGDGFTLPESFPAVTVTDASLTVTPSTGALAARLASRITWTLPFARTSFRIVDLVTEFDLGAARPEPTGAARPYVFVASGSFQFLGIQGSARFEIGRGERDGLISVDLTNSTETLNLPAVANQLTTGSSDPSDEWATVLPSMPVGFAALGALTVKARIDLTKQRFVLSGSSSVYGSVGFVTEQLEDESWGFIVAAKLADTFTFASLLPELAAIDGVMSFGPGSASIVYASFEAGSVRDLTSSVPSLAEAVTIPGTDPAVLRAGVNFYAELSFADAQRGTLMGNVSELLHGVDQKPDLVVSGHVARPAGEATNGSLDARFSAHLGDFSVLGVLDFTGVGLDYALSEPHTVALVGGLIVTVFRDSDHEQRFHSEGGLVVTGTRADFTMKSAAGGSLREPLGMTGVTITDLQLAFSHVFGTSAPVAPASTTLELRGQAKIGQTAGFGAQLSLVNGSVALIEVTLALDPPFGVASFITSAVGVDYPSDYVDLRLSSGQAYYYQLEADPEGRYASISVDGGDPIRRSPGFNLQTISTIFERSIVLRASLGADGFRGTGRMNEPIDLGYAQFSDDDFTGSPSIRLDVLAEETSFGLDAGLSCSRSRSPLPTWRSASLATVPTAKPSFMATSPTRARSGCSPAPRSASATARRVGSRSPTGRWNSQGCSTTRSS